VATRHHRHPWTIPKNLIEEQVGRSLEGNWSRMAGGCGENSQPYFEIMRIDMRSRDALPWYVLLFLLAGQSALVAFEPPRRFWGDEPYYVNKARFLYEHGRFQKAQPQDLAAEAGAWGNSDWRPQGYPAIVAAVSGGNFDAPWLRSRVATLQFAIMATAVALAFGMLRAKTFQSRILAAIVMGLAPWPFAFVSTVGPDSLNASLAFFGVYLLARWTTGSTALWSLLAGSLLLSVTFLLRPEMIAVVPVTIVVAVIARHSAQRTTLRDWSVAAAAFILVVALQYGYRSYFIGRLSPSLFGGLHIYNAGAFEWVNSWLGTEDEAYDFVYGLTEGNAPVVLPSRAFADDGERQIVDELRAEVRAKGFSESIDRRFGELARQRKREHPVSAAILPRLWHAAHLWFNTETNDQLLRAWKPVWRPIRRGLLAVLLLMKATLVMAFGLLLAWQRRMVLSDPVIAVMASLVIARTLLVGVALNWMVSRYMVVGWLPLMVVVSLLMPGTTTQTVARE